MWVNLPLKNSKTGNPSPNSSWFLCFPVLGSQSMYVNTLTWTTTTTTTTWVNFFRDFLWVWGCLGKRRGKTGIQNQEHLIFWTLSKPQNSSKWILLHLQQYTESNWENLGFSSNNFQTVNLLLVNVLNLKTHEWWIFPMVFFSILKLLHQKTARASIQTTGFSPPNFGGVFLRLFFPYHFWKSFFLETVFFTDDVDDCSFFWWVTFVTPSSTAFQAPNSGQVWKTFTCHFHKRNQQSRCSGMAGWHMGPRLNGPHGASKGNVTRERAHMDLKPGTPKDIQTESTVRSQRPAQTV